MRLMDLFRRTRHQRRSSRDDQFARRTEIRRSSLAASRPRPALEPLEDRCLLSITISEFGGLTSSSGLAGIAAAADGRLWFAEHDAVQIGAITTDGTMVDEFSSLLSASPVDITAGSDGDLWFIAGNRVKAADTDGGADGSVSLPSGSNPSSITSGPDLALWVTEPGTDKIARVTTDHDLTEFDLAAGSDPADIVAGPDGNLWFTEPGTNKIGRITPAGVLTEFNVPTASSGLAGITAGLDGNLWFTEKNTDTIGRISPSGSITEFPLATATRGGIVAIQPTGITTGPDGNLWFTETNTNKIGRMTPLGVLSEFAIPTASSGASHITLGPDGNLWFTETTANQIGRVNVGKVGIIAVGSDVGRVPQVKVFDPNTQQTLFTILAYPENFVGGVRVATGDVNGDGIPDIITAPGGGRGTVPGPAVHVFNGLTGVQLAGSQGTILAEAPTFRTGIFVAAGDVNGDGKADIITGSSASGPHVHVFDGGTGTELPGPIGSFLATDLPFRGGVRVAAGDVNGDGRADIIVGGSAGGSSLVRVFDGVTRERIGGFSAFAVNFRGGVFVAAGDVNGDGKADIVAAAGGLLAGSPHVRVFSGANFSLLGSFTPYEADFRGGVRVAVGDVNGDGRADIITGPGPGRLPEVRAFDGKQFATQLFAFTPFEDTFRNGVFVAASMPPHVPFSPVTGLPGECASGPSDACFVARAYRDLLHRPIDAHGMNTFVPLLESGFATTSQVATALLSSPEYFSLFTRDLYSKFLNRTPTTAELASAFRLLSAGASPDQLRAQLLSSDEYFALKGGVTPTVDSFLAGIYIDVLGRPIDEPARVAFTQSLGNGATRYAVAQAVLGSVEADQKLVQFYFRQFLGRDADAGELTPLVNVLQAGAPDKYLVGAILGSDEYFDRQP